MSGAKVENEDEHSALRERVRAASAPATLSDAGALFGALTQDLARETGAAARLRALPTGLRVALGLGVASVLCLLTVLVLMRPDVADYPRARGALELAVLGALLAAAVTVALRPVHRPPVTPARARLLDAAALVAVLVVALLPQVIDFRLTALEALASGGGCLALGALAGLAEYAALRVLDRGAPGSMFAAAAAAGLTANLVLHLHCPAGDPLHTLAGHVGASLLLLAVAAFRARQAR